MTALMTDPSLWVSFATLTVLEIVLGIDNLVFLAILANRVAPSRRALARRLGLGLALIGRLALLSTITLLARLSTPLVSIGGHAISARDLILILGGSFLLYKATREIHVRMEGEAHAGADAAPSSFISVIAQIVMLDLVFSIDSVITAIGIADNLWVMMAAITVAVVIMMVLSGPLTGFIEKHPTVKMLALSFLLMIGMTLVADGFGFHVPKGYIYAAMGFSVLVEALNLLVTQAKRREIR